MKMCLAACLCVILVPVETLSATKTPIIEFQYTLRFVNPERPSNPIVYNGIAKKKAGEDYFHDSLYSEQFQYSELSAQYAEDFGIEYFMNAFVYARDGAPSFYIGPDYYEYGESKILYDIKRSFIKIEFNLDKEFTFIYDYYYSYYRFGGLFPFPEDQISESIVYDSRTGGERRYSISEFYDETTELSRDDFSLQITRVTPVPAPLPLVSLALGVAALLIARGRARPA